MHTMCQYNGDAEEKLSLTVLMASVSAEQNAHRLKLSHPKLFTDICYTHAGRLLAVSDRCHVVRLLGDVQGQNV